MDLYSYTPIQPGELRMCRFVSEQHKSLDIIGFASLFVYKPGSSLPSWVPDWRARIQPLVVPLMASQRATSVVGNLRPPRLLDDDSVMRRYDASGSKEAAYKFEDSTLSARCCIIDVVNSLAGAPGTSNVADAEQIHEKSRASEDVLRSVCRSLVLDRHPMPQETFYRDFLQLCLLVTQKGSRGVDNKFIFWFDEVRDLEVQGFAVESYLNDIERKVTRSLLQMPAHHNEYLQDSFYGRWFDTVQRMSFRLMATRDDRIGMASPKVKRGET